MTASDAPEETGMAGSPPPLKTKPSRRRPPRRLRTTRAAPVVPGTAAAEASPVATHRAPEEAGGSAPAGTDDGESSPEAKGAVENEEHNA